MPLLEKNSCEIGSIMFEHDSLKVEIKEKREKRERSLKYLEKSTFFYN